MIRRTKDYILENKMINNHSTVLVALSGGAGFGLPSAAFK